MPPKRKASGDNDGGGAGASGVAAGPAPGPAIAAKPRAPPPSTVHPRRVRKLNECPSTAGPVIYWCQRDQRVQDNWALLYAAEQARASGQPLAFAFNMVTPYLGAGARQYCFLLRGMQETAAELDNLGIPFFFLQGDPGTTLPKLASESRAGLVVCDYSPLRPNRTWRSSVAGALASRAIAMHEVDAHNIVPVWVASDKQEVGARTLRPKIHRLCAEYLTDFPAVITPPTPWRGPAPPRPDWGALLAAARASGSAIPEVPDAFVTPGAAAGAAALTSFLVPARAKVYESRNDPSLARGQSGLSPWLHFGQLSAQRAAWAAQAARGGAPAALDSFFEELVIRRELSDNFCHYQPAYDSLAGAAAWARESLEKHGSDPRDPVYTRPQLLSASTADDLWNAAQREMVHTGRMHGFMRMYWAKKILEWSPSPAEALSIAIEFNDAYLLDGRDPNGYAGCMWSICGIHDMGWAERAIFGKIRYMNYAGCKRKFKIPDYIQKVGRLVLQAKKFAAERAGGAGAAGAGATAAEVGAAVPGQASKSAKGKKAAK